jgi:hypothetical protein
LRFDRAGGLVMVLIWKEGFLIFYLVNAVSVSENGMVSFGLPFIPSKAFCVELLPPSEL